MTSESQWTMFLLVTLLLVVSHYVLSMKLDLVIDNTSGEFECFIEAEEAFDPFQDGS